jgi:hypothetical protein
MRRIVNGTARNTCPDFAIGAAGFAALQCRPIVGRDAPAGIPPASVSVRVGPRLWRGKSVAKNMRLIP